MSNPVLPLLASWRRIASGDQWELSKSGADQSESRSKNCWPMGEEDGAGWNCVLCWCCVLVSRANGLDNPHSTALLIRVLYCTVVFTVLYCPVVLHCSLLFSVSVLWFILLCCTALHICIMLYCIAVLYRDLLHCKYILCSTALHFYAVTYCTVQICVTANPSPTCMWGVGWTVISGYTVF